MVRYTYKQEVIMQIDLEARDRFAQNLRDLMYAKQFTVQAMSEASGLSISAIMNYRMKKHDVGISGIFILARSLGCKPSELVK